MRRFLSLCLLVLPISYGWGQTYTGNPNDIDTILENIAQFSSYVINADYESIGDSYTSDGKIFPNNRRIIQGREQIMDYWRLPEGVQTIAHKIRPTEIKILGEEAYDYGYYEGTTRRANGEEFSWKGKYVIVWKKVDQKWKMYLDIWNRVAD